VAEEKVITELPDVAVKGRQWLRKLPEDSFVLVHKTFTRLKDAQGYMRNKDWLVNARIVPVYTDGKDEARFAVMTGFFRSKERAKTTIERLGLSADVSVMAVPVAVSQAVPKNAKP
jgi:septal ring-binding cell division protein DamX